jgi:hypothetical protein
MVTGDARVPTSKCILGLTMKLFQYRYRYDYGHDWYIQVLRCKNWSFLQASVSWNDFPAWPYIQIKSGCGSTLSILFWAYKFGFDFDVLSRTWHWDVD